MNKLSIFSICLSLIACSSPDSRPSIDSQGERLLTKGVIDYKNDNYSGAQQNFNHALIYYLSIDNNKGTQLARINLIEALLAVNLFATAEKHLRILKQQQQGQINDLPDNRITLLEVKLLFKKQKYHESLQLIEPLLLAPEMQELKVDERLELLAIAARLEALLAIDSEYQWVKQFRAAVLKARNIVTKFQVILKRIDAIKATQNLHYDKALKLLHEALNYYKKQTDRRAIAACLEEMADIELKQQHKTRALGYLNRALTIRVWIRDQYHIDKIEQKIIPIQTES